MGKQFNLPAHHLQTDQRWELPTGMTYSEANTKGLLVASKMISTLAEIFPLDNEGATIIAPAILNTAWRTYGNGMPKQFRPVHTSGGLLVSIPHPVVENQRLRAAPTKGALLETVRWRLNRQAQLAPRISDEPFRERSAETAVRKESGVGLSVAAIALGLTVYGDVIPQMKPEQQHELALSTARAIALDANTNLPARMHGIPPTLEQLSSSGSPLSGFICDQLQGAPREALVEAQRIVSTPLQVVA